MYVQNTLKALAFLGPGMLSARIKNTSVTSDEKTIAKTGKQRIANFKLPFFS